VHAPNSLEVKISSPRRTLSNDLLGDTNMRKGSRWWKAGGEDPQNRQPRGFCRRAAAQMLHAKAARG
jgi:hypothetical protein